jgi:hypothetical protein
MMNTINLSLLAIILLPSCLQRPVIYTGSQLGVHAQGVKEGIPQKATLGYDRIEFAWLPRGKHSSIKAAFDAEYRGFHGLAVSDLLATGAAAGGSPGAEVASEPNQSLVVSTTTKFNMGLEAGTTDGNAPSLNAGLKRSVFAVFPEAKRSASSPVVVNPLSNYPSSEQQDLPSTYTDLSVHASGLAAKIPAPKGIDEKRRLSSETGVRIVQTVATGEAATRLGQTGNKGEAGKKLNKIIRAGLGLKAVPAATASTPETDANPPAPAPETAGDTGT